MSGWGGWRTVQLERIDCWREERRAVGGTGTGRVQPAAGVGAGRVAGAGSAATSADAAPPPTCCGVRVGHRSLADLMGGTGSAPVTPGCLWGTRPEGTPVWPNL